MEIFVWVIADVLEKDGDSVVMVICVFPWEESRDDDAVKQIFYQVSHVGNEEMETVYVVVVMVDDELETVLVMVTFVYEEVENPDVFGVARQNRKKKNHYPTFLDAVDIDDAFVQMLFQENHQIHQLEIFF